MTQMKNQTSKHNKCKCGQTKPAIWNTCAWCLHENPMNRKVRRPLSTLWLNVKISPASDIEQACQDAIALADDLGVTVWFDFNDVTCGARPGDDWKLLVANWRKNMLGKSPQKVACANHTHNLSQQP